MSVGGSVDDGSVDDGSLVRLWVRLWVRAWVRAWVRVWLAWYSGSFAFVFFRQIALITKYKIRIYKGTSWPITYSWLSALRFLLSDVFLSRGRFRISDDWLLGRVTSDGNLNSYKNSLYGHDQNWYFCLPLLLLLLLLLETNHLQPIMKAPLVSVLLRWRIAFSLFQAFLTHSQVNRPDEVLLAVPLWNCAKILRWQVDEQINGIDCDRGFALYSRKPAPTVQMMIQLGDIFPKSAKNIVS